MLPEKHLAENEILERRKKVRKRFVTVLVFLISLLFLGPLVHELLHIGWLKLVGCRYRASLGLWFTGLHGEVKPLCYLQSQHLVVFYTVGYVGTLVTAGISNLLSLHLYPDRGELAVYLSAAGSGMVLSILITVTRKGDIARAVKTVPLPEPYTLVFTVLVFTAVAVISFQAVELLLYDLERE